MVWDNYECEGQMSFEDYLLSPMKSNKKIRLIELFAGVGSQAMALRNIGADFEHYRVVEFDKYAMASYNAIHGTSFEPTDITQVSGSDLGIKDTDRYIYIMTYSFPCQDLSVAGKMRGMEKGSGTRSSLLFEVERLLDEVEELPQVLLMENVPQVISKKNEAAFGQWKASLEWKGYKNYIQVLNAKDYGVAQSRKRCFMVSVLGDKSYQFPKPVPLEKCMKDYLEDEVDEKYYINSEKAKKLIDKLVIGGKLLTDRQTDRQLISVSKTQELSTQQIVSKQDTMPEYPICKQMVPELLSGCILKNMGSEDKKREPDMNVSDVAVTIMARDYKGLNNYGSNGVLECKKLNA